MLQDLLATFRSNAEDVERLVNFDREVLQVVVLSLEDLHMQLKPIHGTPQMNGGRVLEVVRGIRDNQSLRSKYSAIFNQAVVLLVSHFSSALGDIFRVAVSTSLEREGNDLLLDEDIKMTFREMKDRGWNLKTSAADLLIAKKDFTFQDMQSTVRAFDTYVGIKLERDKVTNNIILGQASRHVIVHSGGVATDRMIKQISKANPRTLKPAVSIGEDVVFSATEVIELRDEMLTYLGRVVAAIESNE
jgi:hypothetical protein